MKELTAPELTSIREQLTQEQNLVVKYRNCAEQIADETVKAKLNDVADRYQKHFDMLYQLLG